MVTQATLDILDAELSGDENTYLSLPEEYRYKNSKENFVLDPYYWQKYYGEIDQHSFQWKEFKYSEMSDLDSEIQSDEIGIYMFIVKPEQRIFDMPKYVISVVSGYKSKIFS